jgi:hypothetical protein
MTKACMSNSSLCQGINFDGKTGFYASYRFCNMTERASWAFDQVYTAANNDSAACTAAGGVLQQPTPARELGADCATLLRQAGPAGTGTITFTPSPGGGGGGGAGQPRGRGVSADAVVGAVIGSVAAVVAAAVLLLRHRARRKREREAEEGAAAAAGGGPDEAGEGGLKAAAAGEDKPGAGNVDLHELGGREQVEIDGNETFEMAGDNVTLEMESTQNEVFELEGSGSISGAASGPVSPLTVAGTPKSATTWRE